jgi:hypothetical protein
MRTMENDELRHERNECNHNNENGMKKRGKIRWRVCEEQVTD